MADIAPRGFFKSVHARKTKNRMEITAQGKAAINVTAGRYQVAVPYHPDWPPVARGLRGRWRHRTAFWSFPLAARRVVLNKLVAVYGRNILTANDVATMENLNQLAVDEEKMREGV